MKRFKTIGVTDEVTACDCCGKDNLKRTVVLLDLEMDEIKFFGTTCASNAYSSRVGHFVPSKDILKWANDQPSALLKSFPVTTAIQNRISRTN